ncbi:hypothetical protein M527_22855 [Sphingobium indicum IP26]|nr:hypothetical protein M527_22855 [Sphingobium indicum IP26]EQB05229.1 hypothetical protein L286_08395 [Sphingobium sp. HDIP04]
MIGRNGALPITFKKMAAAKFLLMFMPNMIGC